jgi:hypothetical protein
MMHSGDPVLAGDYDFAWPDAFAKLAARVRVALAVS